MAIRNRDKPGARNRGPGSVRIIGGEWRGRRLPVVDQQGLRPSGDRCRETLFNWLQMDIRGAHCADLFAGTGVLGLEAASRGAAEVTLVEKSPPAAKALREALEMLGRPAYTIIHHIEADGLQWLGSRAACSLDIVFIDPPFGSGLEAEALEKLSRGDCMRPGGVVYMEMARSAPPLRPGPGWEIAREKSMGDVRMLLLKKI